MSKKEIFGWSMYDFANTIFSALFVTIYFPLFVVLLGGTAFHVGLVFSLSMLLAAFLVPTFGAVADITGRKKLLLFIFTVACCLLTVFIGFVGLVVALILGLFANFFYNASLDVYDSMLVDITEKKGRGWISGIGISVGYLGTVLAVLVAFGVGSAYGFESFEGIRIIFLLIGILFFLFSLFTFALYRERTRTKIRPGHFKQAFGRVLDTIKKIRKYKNVWLFLLASFLYFNAANTAIVFLFLFGRDQLGLSVGQFLPIFLLMALGAAAGSLIFGKVTDKAGHKRTLMIILAVWIAVILLLFFKTTFYIYLATGIIGGGLLGGLWTVTRPLLINLAPTGKIAELFGYLGLTKKSSGVIGPLVFGAVATFIGFREALLVVITFFVLGAIVLGFVKVKK